MVGLCVRAWALPVTNGGFEQGLTDWRVFAGGGAAVTASADGPAAGRACARLLSTADDPAALISSPLPISETGIPFELQLRLRALSGSGRLTIGLTSQAGADNPPQSEFLWAATADDTRWHVLKLTVVASPNPQHVALTATGGGEWTLDEVEVFSHKPPQPHPHEPMADATVYPETLPADWAPADLLDARRRQILDSAELLLDLAGMQIRLPEKTSCQRGVRGGIDTYCVNRGSAQKQLDVSIQGPPDVRVPDWSVPVPPRETLHFYVPVQRLLVGDCRLKITFACNNQRVSAPLLLHCEPAYPAMGLTWSAGSALERATAGPMPVGAAVQHFIFPPQQAEAFAQAVTAGGAGLEYVLSPTGEMSGDTMQKLATPDEAGRRHSWFPYTTQSATTESASAALCGLAEYLHRLDGSPRLFSFPYRLQCDDGGALTLPPGYRLSAASLHDCPGNTSGTWGLQSLVLEMPPLPAATVLQAALDGRSVTGPSAYWKRINYQTDLAPIREAARADDARLPFTVLIPPLGSSGDRRIDALKLGRAMADAVYQGATAVLVDAGQFDAPDLHADQADPVAQAFTGIAAELAAASPVMALEPTETMSPRPDATVTYKLFLRGNEGIAVMWNNTHAPVEVAVGLRSQPVTARLVRLAYYGDFLRDELQSIFRFSQKAREKQQPAIYLRLDPLDITVLSMRLVDPHIGWLRGVFPADEFNLRLAPKDRGPQWWERLFF